MNKCFCDICGCEIPYGLGEVEIIIPGAEGRDQVYIDKTLTHLCEDCSPKLLGVIKQWIKDHMSDKNKERIKD